MSLKCVTVAQHKTQFYLALEFGSSNVSEVCNCRSAQTLDLLPAQLLEVPCDLSLQGGARHAKYRRVKSRCRSMTVGVEPTWVKVVPI